MFIKPYIGDGWLKPLAVVLFSVLAPQAQSADAPADLPPQSEHAAMAARAQPMGTAANGSTADRNEDIAIGNYAAKWLDGINADGSVTTYHDALIEVSSSPRSTTNQPGLADPVSNATSYNNVLTKAKSPCPSGNYANSLSWSAPLDSSGESKDPICLDTVFNGDDFEPILKVPLSQEATLAAQAAMVIYGVSKALRDK